MDNIATEYKSVNYKRFLTELSKSYNTFRDENKKTESDVASGIGTSTITVRNCFKEKGQMVSDQVLTNLMKFIGMEGKIEWYHGKKSYLISIF